MSEAPHRAFELIVKIGADTKDVLVSEIMQFAARVARNEISHGVMGGAVAGAIYSYVERPEQTHDAYFQQLDELLEREQCGKT